MQDAKHRHGLPPDTIGNKVWCVGHNQFTGALHTARTAHIGMVGKLGHSCKDGLCNLMGGNGVVLVDMVYYVTKVLPG